MVIDGFKSYGQRTEINGFDPLFNAITGLNGSGKSNILDSICFLLGITNLSHVRATNLQELVYKNGQAGVTKATVTIVFDNSDKNQSPIGYEHYKEVTITRQVVIGGRNKYLINGTTVQNNRVADFFGSVQLNVNNPHFLIMQGRITKVLNMKPPEILAMIEEAAGTRMYESKKQAAEKTIEKKDAKLKEINNILSEDIEPTITKLKEERSQYLEFQKVQRELEHLTKLHVAYRFLSADQANAKCREEQKIAGEEMEALKGRMEQWEAEAEELRGQMEGLQQIRDTETGGRLKEAEAAHKEAQKEEAKAASALRSLQDTVKTEEKERKQLTKSIEEDEKTLASKLKEGCGTQAAYDTMREKDTKAAEEVASCEARLQAISTGMYAAEGGGEDATLQDQLIRTKAAIQEAKTRTKQAEMKLTHTKQELKRKAPELQKTEAQHKKDMADVERIEREVANYKTQMESLGFDPAEVEGLEERRRAVGEEVLGLQEEVDRVANRYPQLCFNYRDPEPGFDRRKVKGLVCRLFKLRRPEAATALEVIAGNRLFNVVVDTEVVGKKLLEKGDLQTRVTIIPLNKINGRPIEQHIVKRAEQLVGADNVQTALSLVTYEKDVQKAMEWVFGGAFVCRDMETANVVTFDKQILRKSVTLDGDVFSHEGTLSGGSRRPGSMLQELDKAWSMQESLEKKSKELEATEAQLLAASRSAGAYDKARHQFELRSHEAELCRGRLQQGAHHRIQEEVNALKATIEECEETVKRCREEEKEGDKQVKDLTEKIRNAKALKEKQLKEATQALAGAKKALEAVRAQWEGMRAEEEGRKLEISELQKSIEEQKKQLANVIQVLEQYASQLEELKAASASAAASTAEALAAVKGVKETLAAQGREIAEMAGRLEACGKSGSEAKLQAIQIEHKLSKLAGDAKSAEQQVARLLAEHEWIAGDRKFFGQPNTAYDFAANDPQEAGRKIQKLEETKTRLGKSVNMRAMNMLGKAEEQYNDLMRKKRIVEKDKDKIETVIRELDEKKKEALKQAWEQVNKDFGSIFGTLLPGTKAKLQPPEGMGVLDGLEVKVAFGDVWKESLSELSGGQRSLVALSLILALLLFKPAPIYILDEVDAALDLSHTQNIGHMLRTHFKHSQFIVVSLKDGMFNNANVLFKTKFVDGSSTVSRHTQDATNITRRK